MTMLTRHQALMDHFGYSHGEGFAHFIPPPEDTGPDEEQPRQSGQCVVALDIWADMGEPELVTVTIEPGNTLAAAPQGSDPALIDIFKSARDLLAWLDGAVENGDANAIYEDPQGALQEVRQAATNLRFLIGQGERLGWDTRGNEALGGTDFATGAAACIAER